MAERFEMRMDEELLDAIDKWRSAQDDLPSRSEAIRRLITQGLSRKPFELSDGDKLIIMMLRDVANKLKVTGDIDIELVADAIVGGHYWGIEWNHSGLFHSHRDKEAEVKFVVDVLDMWSFIETSFEKLSVGERKRVKDRNFGQNPKFVGFDGNNESTEIGICHFLVEQLGRFQSFGGRELNSHCPKVANYTDMLRQFLPMRKKLAQTHAGMALTAEQLISLLENA